MDPDRNNRTLEMERKKQKLAELRAQRARETGERRDRFLAPLQNGNAQRRETASADELGEILRSVGVDAEPRQSPQKINGVENVGNKENLFEKVKQKAVPEQAPPLIMGSRNLSLELTSVSTIAIPVRDPALYSKGVQTDDDRAPEREFSLGSQEFDFDDDMMGMDGFRDRTHSHELDSPMTDGMTDLARFLPGYRPKALDEENVIPEEKQPEAPKVLTEEEKNQICSKTEFQLFLHNAAKIMERALAVDDEVYAQYCLETTIINKTDELITLKSTYADSTWTTNRCVTDINFGSQHKELVVVAYGADKDQPFQPAGVVCVWNTKIKMGYPEFIFHCNSRLTSITFGRFHQHLIMAGCYSGQIAVWDYRIVNKKTPVNRSPLTSQTHTQPVYGLDIIGTANSHNMFSVSSEGKICVWNIENLNQPIQASELHNKIARKVPILSVSYCADEAETFVAGAEDGKVFQYTRDSVGGATILPKEEYSGHSGPVLCIHTHAAPGGVNFSHLFLSGSSDWSIKLWSTKDPQLRMSFDSHQDAVVAVKWSPIHPAVFASIDQQGFLLLWNLNDSTENAIFTIDVLQGEGVLRKLEWSENGRQICVGDGKGTIYLFDIHEVLYTAKNEEFIKFAQVLANVKQEADEDFSIGGGTQSNVAALAGASLNTLRAN